MKEDGMPLDALEAHLEVITVDPAALGDSLFEDFGLFFIENLVVIVPRG